MPMKFSSACRAMRPALAYPCAIRSRARRLLSRSLPALLLCAALVCAGCVRGPGSLA
ncbi:peptidase C39 family protein, partial [Desulfovibrio oxamicus]|nr:peptidase C39 family protein [Nitratidesulfovibrio oxamicus]